MSDKKEAINNKLTAYERWELPHLESNQKKEPFSPGILIQKEEVVTTEEVDQDTLVYEPLTASQLEEIRSAAYDEGFIQGEEDGYQKGYEDGYSQGQINGFDDGFEQGLATGTNEGREAAKVIAKDQLEQLESVLTKVVQEITHPLEESRAAAENLLYQTMVRMVENVCLSHMKENGRQVLKDQLARLLEDIGEYEGRVRLRLHPNTIGVLEELDVVERFIIQVDEDDTLIEGSFVLDSKAFHVDGRVEQRLEATCNELRLLSVSKE